MDSCTYSLDSEPEPDSRTFDTGKVGGESTVTAGIKAEEGVRVEWASNVSRADVPTNMTMAATVIIFALIAVMSGAVTARNVQAWGGSLGQFLRAWYTKVR